MRRLLADRLMTLLRAEISAFERALREEKPISSRQTSRAKGTRRVDAGAAGAHDGKGLTAAEPAKPVQPTPTAGRKERIDALSAMTRTLEKLLDLKRLERLAGEGAAADGPETQRLRDELMLRLQALDARRQGSARLFLAPFPDASAGPGQSDDPKEVGL